jgi:AAA domain
MMDVILASKLVRAVPAGAHLLLAGDAGQLPWAGAGEVPRVLLAAGAIARVRLTQIFRQARQCGIIINAHRINHGQPPQLTGFPGLCRRGGEPPRTPAGTRRNRPPGSSRTSPPGASPPGSGSTRSATSRC